MDRKKIKLRSVYRLGRKRNRTKPLKDIATAGVTALVSIPLISETAKAVNRI